MAGSQGTIMASRMRYVVPATVFLGLLTLTLSYKMYIGRPSKTKKMLRNEAYAEELWQYAHQKNPLSEDSKVQR